jgi:2-haloacid dehalogenase
MQTPVTAVVFDLGGVVLDWNPRHLYRRVLPDDDAVEQFLNAVCTLEWHAQHDYGRPMAETIPQLSAEHPEHASTIAIWRERYVEMVAGYIDGMPAVLSELQAVGIPLYALTNMPAEVVPELRAAFPLVDMFEGMIVSGEELVMKPDPEIYHRLATRFDLEPNATVFVDDMPVNVDAAWELGFRAVRFESADALRSTLANWGLSISVGPN